MDDPRTDSPFSELAYDTPGAFRTSLVDRINRAASIGHLGVPELRRQMAYDRLLCRVFGLLGPEWLLKGAAGLLARVPNHARHSMDVDLFRRGTISEAVEELQSVAARNDLGDYFSFDISVGRSGVDVSRLVSLSVIAYLGEREFERFKIDLVVNSNMTGQPELIEPIRPVDVRGLSTQSYRVYPLVDHVADKLAAMIETHGGRPSTRYRDLVDLVIVATTQHIEARELHAAIISECAYRDLAVPAELTAPSQDWDDGYRTSAATAPHLAYPTLRDALAVVKSFLDPVLAGRAGGHWDPDELGWRA